MNSLSPDSLVVGASVALGGGLLIGLERERRKRDGAEVVTAGVRSFGLAAFAGALTRWLDEPLLMAAGALAVLALSALASWRGRDDDPSLVTELALFITYLLGLLSMTWPLAGAGAAVVVTAVLAQREPLHRFATGVLSEAELHDTLLLGALALVLLPLMPRTPLPWLGGAQPHLIVMLMVLILLLQAAGHIALRLFGARLGLGLSGFFSGFVSSTATIAAMGARARAHPEWAAACLTGARLSTAATWVQVVVMLLALAPQAAVALAPVAGAGLLVALLSSAWPQSAATQTTTSAQHNPSTPQDAPVTASNGRVLRLREALLVALMLTGVTLLVSWAQRSWGNVGAVAGAVVAGFGDAHASVLAFGAMTENQQITTATATAGVLASITANSLTRSITAFVAGGPSFGLRLTVTLLASVVAAWAVWALVQG